MRGPGIFGGRKSLFGHEGSETVVVDLNLTPLMDVMSNILFFLLASFGAAILSFMAASVPVETDDDTVTTEPPRTDRVTVNIQLEPGGYRLSLSSDRLSPERLDKAKKFMPKVEGAYPAGALKDWAYEIKGEFPASDTAVLLPSDECAYTDIVQTMDALRYKSLGGNQRMRLLPKIVMAQMMRADEPGEEGADDAKEGAAKERAGD